MVSEAEASGGTRRIYEDIKHTLGLSSLELFYPALGAYPKFLDLHWQLVKPVAETAEFFDIAGRLRADAYTRAHSYFRLPDLRLQSSEPQPDGEESRLNAAVEFYHHEEPLVLLLFCYQLQALEGQTGQLMPTTHRQANSIFPAPELLREASADPALKKRYEEIRRSLGMPFVNSEFCAFARFPGFFGAYWEALKQMCTSPLYDECVHAARSTAWTLAAQLPGPAEITPDQLAEAGIADEEVATAARILDLFVGNLSGQLLNISAAKIALEGGNILPARHDVPEQEAAPAA